MLNESKIKMMTKMASYEKNEGKEDISICRFFRSDYIGLGILKNGIAVTIAYIACACVYFLCNIEVYLQNIAKLDYAQIISTVGKYYVMLMIAFIIISYVYYSIKYDKAKKNIVFYTKRLKKLEKYYKKGNR